MRINVKTQTNRSTNWKEGLNCVNLFLTDHHSNTKFEVGMQVTEWGERKEILPIITFESNGEHYQFPVNDFEKLLKASITH